MIKNHVKIALLSILVCLFTVSCNRNSKQGVKSDSQETKKISDKAEQSETGTEFTIPFPEGGEMITDNRTEKTGSITLLYDADRYDEILKFYANYASGSDWKHNEFGQGERKSISYLSLQKIQTIAISPADNSSKGKIMVTLTAG